MICLKINIYNDLQLIIIAWDGYNPKFSCFRMFLYFTKNTEACYGRLPVYAPKSEKKYAYHTNTLWLPLQ